MTGQKENVRDFQSLDNVGVVNFGNNKKCKVKGYGKVTNRMFTVNWVAYVEGLQYNLICVSQLVVGIVNRVVFVEGSVISNIEMKEVLLKSKMKGDMFTLNMRPIVGVPSICLLSKVSYDLS